jgi:hypothetical protein
MNTSNIVEIIGHVAKYFATGCIVGIPVSLFTIILMRRLAKRAKYYRLTYVPMTLVESKLWKCALIAYPLAFGLSFTLLCVFKMIQW